MDNIKTWANTHSWVKIAVYLLTFLFPALAFAQFYLPLQSPVNPYCLVWIGFYSCLFLCWAYKGFLFKVPSVLANLSFMGFLFFGSLMGGLYGILLFLYCLCVPALPLFFLF
ncbi:hypothetical protein [Anaerotignum sp.]|uniref:hypothetical protein n=1 Tax=Anaerotignum sp. TaxID=2039241 RepID=UPI0027B941F6|nr:hypothetical protein [Anaerotignum sp.]